MINPTIAKGTSGGECYGTYDSTTYTGSGPGYTNACIHSGTIESIGTATVWYNYGAGSASSITGTSNIIMATQSICPKGWTLPSNKEVVNMISSSNEGEFPAAVGGWYYNGVLNDESTTGVWWTSEASNTAMRYDLTYRYSSDTFVNGSGWKYGRNKGHNIRCVSEEKDVSDLTYMQDMTPSIATNTAEGTASPPSFKNSV